MADLGNNHDDEGPLAMINIIPFVDIVLVLLVIFMLTATAIVRASLKVELPKAASGGARVESTVNLLYTKDQELLLNGKAITRAEAARYIRQQATANPKTQAVVSADKGVPYGEVFTIIDLVKQNGISVFALDVERKRPAAEGASP